MGSFFSSDLSVDDVCPTPQRVRTSDGSTPSALDPRSPTPGVVRSPIHISATPHNLQDPRSPTAGIPRTPISAAAAAHTHLAASSPETEEAAVGTMQSVTDPRSPSVGIARTPIELLKAQTAFAVRSIVEGGVPKCDLDDDEEEGLDVDVRPSSLVVQTVASTEPREADQESSETPLVALPVPAAAADVLPRQRKPRNGSSARPIQGNVSKPMPAGCVVIFADDTSTEGSQPEVRSVAPVSVASPARPASSLRNVDVNSPRRIVQQKLMQRAEILKQAAEVPSPLRQAQAVRSTVQQVQDKENRR